MIGQSVDGGGVSSVSMLGVLTQREGGIMEKKARKGLVSRTESFLYSLIYNVQPRKGNEYS